MSEPGRPTPLLLCLSLCLLWTASAQDLPTASPTASPRTEFIASPNNVTVLEGHPAVLRCKLKDTVHNCQWFYLDAASDMFDTRSKPILVTEFRPTKDKDCSIKLSQVKRIQGGQWSCKGLQIHARKYVVSKPAFLTVISADGSSLPSEDGLEEEEDISDLSFMVTEEGHIINTKLDDTAVLGCQANRDLKSCSWIKPDGTTLRFSDATNGNYALQGEYEQGNCSLVINKVSARDEGNWRCIVSIANNSGENLGPLIHLHVLEFGPHPEGASGFSGEKTSGSSLIVILVITSLVLLVIIVALVCYMYKHVWRKNAPPHRYLNSSESGNIDYSNYGTTWLPGKGDKDQKLIDESTAEMRPSDPSSNEYTRYVDMSGSGKGEGEGYVSFPASSTRSSMASKTTVRVGENAGSDGSARSSATASLHSGSTFGNPTYDKAIQERALPQRQDSVYSEGHLYEEIDEARRKKEAEDEFQLSEDQEGYMIPNQLNRTSPLTTEDAPSNEIQAESEQIGKSAKAPPYSKVGEGGLVIDTEGAPFASNSTYSGGDEGEEPEESYNVPSGPPVPVRVDSVDNPLAEYDVPKPTSRATTPVFV